MASITIRNLDDNVKTRLRVRAAEHHHSMEAEARLILHKAVEQKEAPRNLASAIRARIAPLGGVDLELPPREPAQLRHFCTAAAPIRAAVARVGEP